MLVSATVHRELALALSLADAADAITMQHFRAAALSIRTKSDHSPVSEADEAAERAIREILQRERPDDGIVGEEYGESQRSARRWIIDPIDATGNYVRGVPVFATLIALQEQEQPVVGVVSAPAMKKRWWATRGEGAFSNGERLRVSDVSSVGESFVGYDTLKDFTPLGLEPRFLSLIRDCGRSRGFGDFWAHMLVAEGAIDIAVRAEWVDAAVASNATATGRSRNRRVEFLIPRPRGGSRRDGSRSSASTAWASRSKSMLPSTCHRLGPIC